MHPFAEKEEKISMAVFFVDLFAIIEGWWNSLIENLPTIVVALVVLLLASWLARLLRNAASRALMLRNTDMEIIVLVSRLVQWSVIGLGILLAASQAGFDITAFLTGLGILGFTLGFALQDVSKNFVAGMLLLILQPFDLGDTIEVSGIQGKVIEVDLARHAFTHPRWPARQYPQWRCLHQTDNQLHSLGPAPPAAHCRDCLRQRPRSRAPKSPGSYQRGFPVYWMNLPRSFVLRLLEITRLTLRSSTGLTAITQI